MNWLARGVRMRKIDGRWLSAIGFIFVLVLFPVLLAMETTEERLREEFASDAAGTTVSFEKYQSTLSKLLSDDGTSWHIGLRDILFVFGFVGLGAVVIFFVRRIRGNLIVEASDEVVSASVETVGTERVALTHADEALASSNFRHALRFLYLSVILHLQERGVLSYDKSLTNREYLRALQTDPELESTLRALRPVIRIFDEVWYGHKPCDEKTVTNYRELLQAVYLTRE